MREDSKPIVIEIPEPDEAEWAFKEVSYPDGYGSYPVVTHKSGLTVKSAGLRMDGEEMSEFYDFAYPEDAPVAIKNGQVNILYMQVEDGERLASEARVGVGLMSDPTPYLLAPHFLPVAVGIRALLRLGSGRRWDVERLVPFS
jgi:hypothetical protein